MRKFREARWFSLIVVYLTLSSAQALSTPLDYAEASRFLKVPLQLNREGAISFQDSQWKLERDDDGTELLKARKIKAQAAVMKKDGKTESVISYVLNSQGKSVSENSTALFFEKGRLTAVTQCEESKKTHDLGRVCVTATTSLCADLRSGKDIDPKNLSDTEGYETRALAAILTLRGSDHQLDNMLKTGNRLGLKSSLQTTRGQLRANKGLSEKERKDEKATTQQTTRYILANSLPRLKASCAEARF